MRIHEVVKKRRTVSVVSIGVIAVVAYAFWVPNWIARRHVTQILLSDQADDIQLAALQPYVRLGDSSEAVARRLSPKPSDVHRRTRPVYHIYGLNGVSLDLAIHVDGTIVGIGRNIYGDDSGPVWLAGHIDKLYESSETQSK